MKRRRPFTWGAVLIVGNKKNSIWKNCTLTSEYYLANYRHALYENKEPVAKEPVYWNDFTLWDNATRYSRCGQKSYLYFFLDPVRKNHFSTRDLFRQLVSPQYLYLGPLVCIIRHFYGKSYYIDIICSISAIIFYFPLIVLFFHESLNHLSLPSQQHRAEQQQQLRPRLLVIHQQHPQGNTKKTWRKLSPILWNYDNVKSKR